MAHSHKNKLHGHKDTGHCPSNSGHVATLVLPTHMVLPQVAHVAVAGRPRLRPRGTTEPIDACDGDVESLHGSTGGCTAAPFPVGNTVAEPSALMREKRLCLEEVCSCTSQTPPNNA